MTRSRRGKNRRGKLGTYDSRNEVPGFLGGSGGLTVLLLARREQVLDGQQAIIVGIGRHMCTCPGLLERALAHFASSRMDLSRDILGV